MPEARSWLKAQTKRGRSELNESVGVVQAAKKGRPPGRQGRDAATGRISVITAYKSCSVNALRTAKVVSHY